jgi:hypothetical protein
VELYELERNDVPAAVAYYGEKRRLFLGRPTQRQSVVEPLMKLQDDPAALGAALAKAYPEDFRPRPKRRGKRLAPRFLVGDGLRIDGRGVDSGRFGDEGRAVGADEGRRRRVGGHLGKAAVLGLFAPARDGRARAVGG